MHDIVSTEDLPLDSYDRQRAEDMVAERPIYNADENKEALMTESKRRHPRRARTLAVNILLLVLLVAVILGFLGMEVLLVHSIFGFVIEPLVHDLFEALWFTP